MSDQFERPGKDERVTIHLASIAASQRRAVYDRYALVQLTKRTWMVIERSSIATTYLGVNDLCIYRLVLRGKHDECLSELNRLRGMTVQEDSSLNGT